jgi:3-methyladenine DNA glycosylase AlkD
MTAAEVLTELESLGNASIKKTLIRHGAREPFFGVKIGDMKPLIKRIKMDYTLSLELYSTGVSDAMYLAALIADDARMTREDLQSWVEKAYWAMLSESAVAWVAAGSPHGWDAALDWIESPQDTISSCGWATLSSIASTRPDEQLDLAKLEALLLRVQSKIHDQPNRTKLMMNSFVIHVGSYVKPLAEKAMETAHAIGKVTADMGDTACKISDAATSILAARAKGSLEKKRKSAKC